LYGSVVRDNKHDIAHSYDRFNLYGESRYSGKVPMTLCVSTEQIMVRCSTSRENMSLTT